MTRETKIGLLVGLGFIVVFAVVLSHTGAPRPPGDGLQLVQGPDKTLDILTPDALEPIGPTPIDVPEEPIENVVVSREPTGPQPSELPSPEELGTPLHVPSDTFADGDSIPSTKDIEGDSHAVVIRRPRIAPPMDNPIPFERNRAPSVSPSPTPIPSAPGLEPDQPPTKWYVVRKGETLGRIAEKHYGTSKPKVVEFLVEGNKGRIKSKDVVIEGQKIVIPKLPSDMFEPAPDFQASNLNRNERLTLDIPAPPKELTGRRAPQQDEAEHTTRPMSEGRSDYTIQPGDTLVKIAREQLGSDAHWKEIQKLNKNLDPKKLRPGMKIRIPARKPVSRPGTPKRVST